MKSGAPWSIKGIEPEARETAKEKAREAGLTLGQWMNQVIADAGHPTPPDAAPVETPAPGSALDTARLMRAIAEVARRVDMLSQQSAQPESDLDARLTSLDNRLEALASAPPPASPEFDQARIERGLLALARRIEAMEQKALTAEHLNQVRDDLAASHGGSGTPPGLEDLESSIAELGRQVSSLPDLSERLERLESGIERIGAASGNVSSGAPELDENIRKLMNGMVNLATKIDGVEKRVDQKLEPLQAKLGELEQQANQPADGTGNGGGIDQEALNRAVAAATAPLAASIAELRDAAARTVMPDPEPETPAAGIGGADDDEDGWISPGDQPTEAPVDEGETDAPESVAETVPEAQPLHDLTDSEDIRVRAFDDETDFFIDDRDDDETAAPAAGTTPEPALAEPEPEPHEPELSPASGFVAAPPLDHVPEDANPPDRPQRLVAVESLLGGAPPPRREEPAAAAEPEPASARDSGRRKPFRLDEPLDLSQQTPASPASYPGRRRWAGYLLAALFFIALFLGGFWFVGTPQFGIIADEIDRMWGEARMAVGEVQSGDEAQAPAAPEPVAEEAPAATATPATDTTDNAVSRPEPVAPRPEAARPEPKPEPAAPVKAAASPSPAESAPAAESDDAPPVDSALVALMEKAAAGDADAQHALGVRYRDGIGTEANYSTAADWFESAAQQGHVPSQLGLGIMYRQGLGRPRDLDLAKLWLHAAARAGDPDAQKLLGEVYVDSTAAAPDYFQAARWFRAAADQGVVDAQFNMGVLYEGGLGVPRNFEEAYYWFLLAARAGDRSAPNEADRVAQQLTPEQRSEIETRVDGFSPSVTTQGEATSSGGGSQADSGSEILRRRDEIRTLQQLLIARGYDPGTPDGLPGSQTRDAIRQWQSDQGISPDGTISRNVLNSLKSGG